MIRDRFTRRKTQDTRYHLAPRKTAAVCVAHIICKRLKQHQVDTYCCTLGSLQELQCCFAAAAAEQSVFYDTMATMIIRSTNDFMYVIPSANSEDNRTERGTYHRQTITTAGGYVLLPSPLPATMALLLCFCCRCL